MKRILIDGRFIGVGESMTRYCLEIVKGILELDHENEYTLLIRPAGIKALREFFEFENLSLENSLKIENCKIENLTIQVMDIPHYSLSEQTKLLKYLNHQQFDLVHFIQFNHPIRYRGKFVVSIHDLTLLGHLHREPVHKRLAFGTVMKSAAENSTKIITISNTSKDEIVEYYGVNPDKIAVTYLAVDNKYNSKIKDQKSKLLNFKSKFNISGDYFLYTGMWKKHKNLIRLLKAYKILIQNSKIKDQNDNSKIENDKNPYPQLVMVGKIDKEEPEVINLIDEINNSIKYQVSGIKNEIPDTSYEIPNKDRHQPIITTGYIEEEELPLAYAGALAYIIPSLSEGFGLPPLEAMACGTPVTSSNASAMPEILGEAALYFDPYNLDDMAEKMLEIASNGQLRADLTARGLSQAQKYSWEQTAKETLKVYNEVLNRSR